MSIDSSGRTVWASIPLPFLLSHCSQPVMALSLRARRIIQAYSGGKSLVRLGILPMCDRIQRVQQNGLCSSMSSPVDGSGFPPKRARTFTPQWSLDRVCIGFGLCGSIFESFEETRKYSRHARFHDRQATVATLGASDECVLPSLVLLSSLILPCFKIEAGHVFWVYELLWDQQPYFVLSVCVPACTVGVSAP